MQQFPVGTDVTVQIPFVDLNGNAVTPTGLSFTVLDENEAVVISSTGLTLVSGATNVDITIPDTANTVPTGKPASVRVVVLTMQTAAGDITAEVAYMVRAANRLSFLKNSFQTYASAQLEADSMPNLDGWLAATDQQREQALVEAYFRLTRLGYYVRWPYKEDAQAYLNMRDTEKISPRDWQEMTLDEWNDYPEDFRVAIRRAQIAEANEIIQGDETAEKRRSGLMSESIGESSMMFRPGKPLNMEISSAALRYLTGYIDLRMTITRS